MTVFWGLAAIMVIVALLFTVPAIMRGGRLAGTDQDALNADIIRGHIAELDTDLKSGRLDAGQYAAARNDLERELLYDLSSPVPESRKTATRSGQWAAILLVAGLPLSAVFLYNTLGSKDLIPQLDQAALAPAKPDAASPGTAHSLEEMVDQLAARMRAQPDDLQGWVMLARSYVVLKRHLDAVNAYANARRLGGDSPELLADYADSLVMSNGGRFTDQAGEMLQTALKSQPDNIKALWLIGHWKDQEGAYSEAIEYWQRAAALLPEDGEDAPVIARQIEQARLRLGAAGVSGDEKQPAQASTASPAADTPAPAAALQVSVALDTRLDAQPDDTVFIFARAMQGPRMPLAIVRKQVKDLPVTVTLDDSMAMSPAMVLSKFDQVLVGARVSKSGNAMPQSGDLQGSVSPVVTRNNTSEVQLTIDSTVP